MIDLSFLTEEEQEAIMKVLQRDADLKKAEEERVKVLEETIDDTNELKNKTGQWFYEEKSKRHRDKIHGADIIRASIRKKPQTIAELSQSRTDKTKQSWVSNVNKDLFLPPELFGVMEDPEREEEEEKTPAQLYRSAPKVDNLAKNESGEPMQKVVSSPSKQRINPFNNPTLDLDFDLTTENQVSENGHPHMDEITEKDLLPSSWKSQYSKKMPLIESDETSPNSSGAVDGTERPNEKQIPKPKARTVTYKIGEPQSDSDSSLTKPSKRNESINGAGTRKGILKRSPSSSSTDSEILRISQSLESQSKTISPKSPILEGETEKNLFSDPQDQSSQHSIDRLKQVRFSSADVPDELPPTPDSHNGREIGEFDLLESDFHQNGMDDIDGFKYLHNQNESSENHVAEHPETVGLYSDMADDLSEEEDDATMAAPFQSFSSNVDNNLRAEMPKREQMPSASSRTIQSLPSNDELLPEQGSPADVTSIRTPQDFSININENEVPSSKTFLNRESTDVLDYESQKPKSAIDQQPNDTQIKSVHVSKPNSSNIQQDQQPLHAEIKSPQVSNLNSTEHQQGSEEELNPVLLALRRSSTTKPVPSKSLEDIASAPSNFDQEEGDESVLYTDPVRAWRPASAAVQNQPEKVDLPREDSVHSEYDQKEDERDGFYETISEISTAPSYPDNRFSDPEKHKRLSKSVPDFLNDESDDRETDSTSEGSFPHGRLKKTPSSLTNLSGSSGMASLSSVSGSVMSIYSGDFGNLDIKGNIQFSIDYVEQLQEFHIYVSQCKDLAAAEVKKNRSDPYVKIYLLPSKEKLGKRKTSVRKKTLCPAYNEILKYKINKQFLLTQKLNLSVWHHDTFGRNSFLGEVDVDLATWDWTNTHMNWYPLQPRTPAAGIGLENRGEMTVALRYTSRPPSGKNTASNGEVHIWVKSCSNLPILRGNRINSFVRCTVLPDTSRKSRQKTRTVDKTVNPVFNHTMVYDGFRTEDLREACVELTVWDHNRLANHFLGGLRLGLGSGKSYGTPVDWMDSTSYEASLWKKMMNSPDEWVEDTLQLRMLMMAKASK